MVATAGRCDWLRLLLCLHSWTAATTPGFFNAAQVRARCSTGLFMARYQDMLAGVVIFSFDGLW